MLDLNKFKQDFNPDLPENLGRPIYFDVDHYLDAVEQMITADELTFAKTMLDNLPGYYRDFVPKRAIEIREKLAKALWGIDRYMIDPDEVNSVDPEVETKITKLFCWPRGHITADMVHKFNLEGISPIIVEVGPADYWLPIGLHKHCQLDFEYLPFSLNLKAMETIKARYPDIKWINRPDLVHKVGKPIIFFCCEVIEHMDRPEEIKDYLMRYDIKPDIIIISTPLYSFGGGLPNWSERPLGHLRTWTPRELIRWADKLFDSGYMWELLHSHAQTLVGAKRPDGTPKA